ncbi:MAG: DUF881 domain-containing protein [Candidatus Gracilibacteria bacterium]
MKKALVITAVVVGIFLALQVRSFKKVESLLQRSDSKGVLYELNTIRVANSELKEEIASQEKQLQEAQSKMASQTIEEELKRLNLASGESPIHGEGIEIKVSNIIQAFWVLDLIAQLVSAGAEAVALNDVRLVESTAGLREIGTTGFVMDKNLLKAPLKISVIGPMAELKRSVSPAGGILDRIKNNHQGIVVEVTEKKDITIPALPTLYLAK